MGISSDLEKLKNVSDLTLMRQEIKESAGMYDSIKRTTIMYIGSSNFTVSENTLTNYSTNFGIFTLYDALEQNLISNQAKEKIEKYFTKLKYDIQYAKYDLTYIINLNF